MTRLKKLFDAVFRAGIGAMVGAMLLAACSKAPPPTTAQSDGPPQTVGESFNTDYDALYDELAGA